LLARPPGAAAAGAEVGAASDGRRSTKTRRFRTTKDALGRPLTRAEEESSIRVGFNRGRAVDTVSTQARGGGGKKKSLSRKKLTLKAQAAKEKGREDVFVSKLFLATGGALTEKLDLGVL